MSIELYCGTLSLEYFWKEAMVFPVVMYGCESWTISPLSQSVAFQLGWASLVAQMER